MDFYINGEQINVQLEAEQTIGDILKSFEKTCEENKAAVIGIHVNGTQITAETFDEEAKKELKSDTKFEFDVITESAISDALKKLSSLFDELAEKIENVPQDFMNGKGKEAHESIKNLADYIDQFCHIVALASLFPETFTKSKIGDKDFKDFFSDFSPVLNDFEEALQNDDTVLIGDLCEYEICPRLKEISSSLKEM